MAKIKTDQIIKKKLSILKASFFLSNCILLFLMFFDLILKDPVNYKSAIIFILILNGILLMTYSIINKYKHMLGGYLESDIMKKYEK